MTSTSTSTATPATTASVWLVLHEGPRDEHGRQFPYFPHVTEVATVPAPSGRIAIRMRLYNTAGSLLDSRTIELAADAEQAEHRLDVQVQELIDPHGWEEIETC